MKKKRIQSKGIAAINKQIDREVKHLAWLEVNLVGSELVKMSKRRLFKSYELRSIFLQSDVDDL